MQIYVERLRPGMIIYEEDTGEELEVSSVEITFTQDYEGVIVTAYDENDLTVDIHYGMDAQVTVID